MPTIILHGAQGAGKSLVAAAVARRLGCTSLIDGWDGKQPVSEGALVVTNLPVDDLRVPLGVSTLGFHQALGML
jgi:SpoVK/Ycf46/Vps4 family AAA+-type ATPase